MNLRPGGMTIVQEQGMEVLGVNLSPSVSFKDRIAARPRVMLKTHAYHLVGRISHFDREAYERISGRIPRLV